MMKKMRQPSRVRSEHERRRGDGGSCSRRHVYREVVKTFTLLFVFSLISSVAYSYTLEVTEYDDSENIALLKKLEAEYNKKHTIDKNHMDGGTESYYREVLEPYIENSKNIEDLPKKTYIIEK